MHVPFDFWDESKQKNVTHKNLRKVNYRIEKNIYISAKLYYMSDRQSVRKNI